MHTLDSDGPNTLWDIADNPLGKDLLFGEYRGGALRLNDVDTVGRSEPMSGSNEGFYLAGGDRKDADFHEQILRDGPTYPHPEGLIARLRARGFSDAQIEALYPGLLSVT